MMELSLNQLGNEFDLSQITNAAEVLTNDSGENKSQDSLFLAEKSKIENDELFLSVKLHIDSQNKLNQINQSRIRSFERFRKYCQRVAQFGDGTTAERFDQEQFRNEYNRFDQNYRHWRKRIRKLRKETESSMSTRYQNPYDTLFELFAKIESLDRSINKYNRENTKPDDQINPKIPINTIEPPTAPVNLVPEHSPVDNNVKIPEENFNCFVVGCLQSKFSSQQDLLDHLFEKHSNEGGETVKAKGTRGRKPTKKSPAKKQSNKTKKKSVVTRRSKAQCLKQNKTETAILQTKRVSKKRKLVTQDTSSDTDRSTPKTKTRTRRTKKESNGEPKVFKCETEGCKYSSSNIWAMNLHKRTHSDERPFKCDKCEVAFKIKGDLKVHQNIHEGRRFACTFEGCTVNYATRKDIRRHIKIFHTKEATLLQCTWEGCKYSTYDPRCLKIHICVHTGERQFKCPQCEQAFKSRANLWRHKLTHQTEHRFKCDFEGCEYSTNGNEYLKSHRMVHFGDRPFKCVWPDCEQAFKTASGLWSHKMIHENQRRYKCTAKGCDYAGNLWRNLHKHEEAMHGKKKLPSAKNGKNRRNQQSKTSITSSAIEADSGQMLANIGPEMTIEKNMIDSTNNNNIDHNVQTLL